MGASGALQQVFFYCAFALARVRLLPSRVRQLQMLAHRCSRLQLTILRESAVKKIKLLSK